MAADGRPGTPPADILDSIDAYYSWRVAAYGATPLGVAWSCAPTQKLRFARLLAVVGNADRLSVNDLGCGYGALLEYLAERAPALDVDYCGVDVSAAMVRAARRRWRGRPATAFAVGCGNPRVADYSLASGIFNIQLEHARADWERHVAATLRGLRDTSRLGFAVNFMAGSADGAGGRAGRYRVAPDRWAEYCERDLACDTELVSGYGLREFTLLVRTPSRSRPPAPRSAAGDTTRIP